MSKPLLSVLLLLPLVGCSVQYTGSLNYPVGSVDEIFSHPEVQIEKSVVDMNFEKFLGKLEYEQYMVSLAEVVWIGCLICSGQPVYKLQRISASKARYIATKNGENIYGLFIIEPSGQSKTRITSYDINAMHGHKSHLDILSSW